VIVVDTNVIAALILPTSEQTDPAMKLLSIDREWAAPLLWRSEFTNILTTGVQNRWFDLSQALEALEAAEEVIGDNQYAVPADEVLKLAVSSGCTGYDCEFALLERDLGVRLVTLDRELLEAFPEVATSLGNSLRELGSPENSS
jgi:predicted nucleic acid-binding protein